MKVVSAEQLHRNTEEISKQACQEPVAIDDRLVLQSMEEFQRLKRPDRKAFRIEELLEDIVDQVARLDHFKEAARAAKPKSRLE